MDTEKKYLITTLVIITIVFTRSTLAQASEEANAKELAMKLANPVSSLISVPFQNSSDIGIGDYKGTRNTLNIQPVVPASLTNDINLVTRVILPVVTQQNITGVGESEAGLGDAVVSMFFNPADSKEGFTWGAGPVFLVPTGTNDFLTTRKFGIGPTVVALQQTGGSTFGALINQIWSVAGDNDRANISALYFQPFYSFNWESGAGVAVDFEISQNWKASTTTVWFIPTISSLASLGGQKVQFIIGPRINLAAPDGAQADFGVRAQLVFLFPR